jgi:hypothetical protein
MKKVSNFILFMALSMFSMLMTSCKDVVLIYPKIDVVAFAPINQPVFTDTLTEVVKTFVNDEGNGIVPLLTIKSLNRVPDFVITQKLERGMVGFNGDITNHKLVKRHIKENILPSLQLPQPFSQPFTPSVNQVLEWERRIKNAEQEGKTYIKFSTNPEDTTAKVHTPVELADLITTEVERGKTEIIVLYNMHFLSPVDIAVSTLAYLTNRTEAANTKTGTEKRNELDKVNLSIEATLNKDANNAHLWYLRAVNRTYAGVPKEAIEYLENAAKAAIEKDSAFMIMDKITENEGTKLKFLAQTQSSKLKAIKNALEKSSVDLIGVIRGEMQGIKGTDEYNLFLNTSNEMYSNTVKNYSIATVSKDGANNVTLNINLVETDARGNKIPRSYANFICPFGVAKPIYYDNNTRVLTIINDSPSDKSYVKLRISNRKQVVDDDDPFVNPNH